MILRHGPWSEWPWLEHGFGTRLAERWTHGAARTWVHQVHGDRVFPAEQPGLQGEGDALITNRPGLLLEIRTADCLPILLADPVNRAVAAIHAGWRGTAVAIVLQAVEELARRYGSEPGRIEAVIGPGIGLCCFEVGPEVAIQFGREGRAYLDLAQVNEDHLRSAGVGSITRIAGCTRCEAERFHSFRRDRERSGRMESAIGIAL